MLTENTEMLQKRGNNSVLFGMHNKGKVKLPEKVKCNPVTPEM